MENVILQIDKETYKSIFSINKKNGINLNQYVLRPAKKMDETEYLLSTKANRKALLESIESSKNPENLVEMRIVNGVLIEVENENNTR